MRKNIFQNTKWMKEKKTTNKCKPQRIKTNEFWFFDKLYHLKCYKFNRMGFSIQIFAESKQYIFANILVAGWQHTHTKKTIHMTATICKAIIQTGK